MNIPTLSAAVGLVFTLGFYAGEARAQEHITATTWTLDRLDTLGGHPATVAGSPRTVDTPIGPAVMFNGATDGLFVKTNPLEGLAAFTIEALIEPAADGGEEQRFVHVQDATGDHRALIELRLAADGTWCLDTYLRFDPPGLTLIDRSKRHPAGRWAAVALTYDGQTMAAYVDGVRELSGAVTFGPLGPGQVSLGVRQNRVSWFKGRIHAVRFSRGALTPAELLKVPVY